MKLYTFILGVNKKLSINELVSLYKKNIEYICDDYMIVKFEDGVNIENIQNRLGGTVKIFEIEKSDKNFEDYILEKIKDEYSRKKHKIKFGINFYPENNFKKNILFKIKSHLKKINISARYMNKTNKNLKSHISYLNKNIIEFAKFISKGKEDLFGRLVSVQDIGKYTALDIKRPFKNMKIGIMPPKLAKIMINLSGKENILYDPFCGNGTILMMALLQGIKVIGSDKSMEALQETEKNLLWLKENYGYRKSFKLFQYDVQSNLDNIDNFYTIVSEGYLGPMIDKDEKLNLETIKKYEEGIKDIYVSFFSNIKKHIKDKPIVISLPFYRYNGKYYYLEKTLESILKIGYNFVGFYNNEKSLRYIRENQKVGREIFKFVLDNPR